MAVVDSETSLRRLEKLYDSWKDTDLWNDVDAIAVIYGKDEVMYSKSTALQLWLFGYELTDTLCVFCENSVHVVASKKKMDFLQPVISDLEAQEELPRLIPHLRNKDDGDLENFKTLCDAMKSSHMGAKVGHFVKDKFSGDFVTKWQDSLNESSLELVDISAPFAVLSSTKEESEIETMKKACQLSCQVFKKFVKKQIVSIVEDEQKVKHSKFAEGIENSYVKTPQILPPGVDSGNVELCYDPIVQSGEGYQLKFSIVSNDEKLQLGTILCSFGFRFKSYCSNLVRTLLVEPSEDQKAGYEFLLELYGHVLSKLVDGTRLCDVYQSGVDFVEEKRPDLSGNLVKSFGFVTGIEFREGSLLIGPKCTMQARTNMTFNVSIGFSQLVKSEEDTAEYALFIGDTVQVQQSEPAVELTGIAKKKLNNIAMLGDDEKPSSTAQLTEKMLTERGSSKILDSRTRAEIPSEDKRKEHQVQLAETMNKQARERFLEQQGSSGPKKQKAAPPVAYKNLAQFPSDPDVRSLKLCVDRKYESLILPIHGMAVPFHICTVKNISRSEEDDFVYLRINFFHPGSAVSKTEETYFPTAEKIFLKEITLRSPSSGPHSAAANFAQGFQTIKEVQKAFRTREAERRELEGVVEQASLILNTSRGNPRLKDLYMRPIIGVRRLQGTLEAHTNGLRYTSLKGDKVDVIYNNVKHAFFQPSKGEMIVVLHFHLKHPIMIRKKKHRDVQFYTEVGEIMTDLGRSAHNRRDRDDYLVEQAERDLRSKLDGAFDNFRKKVENLPQSHISFEIPFRELGYFGVPFRSSVLLQPTTNCLVNIAEQPPFIVTLDEIELIHFERVQFHMKNIDMVIVFKDYKKKVVSVNSIPMNSLDSIKEWLNSFDIKYTEGIQSLNWAKIMKTIIDDPVGFFENGGWSFLDPESDVEPEDDEDEDSDGFQVSDEEETVSESDSDEDYTDISENSEEEVSEAKDSGSGEESGMDWDDLEDEAREDDDNRDTDEERERSSKKRPASSSNPHPKKHRR